ncbi:unnamed protein product [Merluccius merluccius]
MADICQSKSLGRNLLKNPAPYGNYTDWTTKVEVLPYDTSGIPLGVVVCHLPQYSWFTLEQLVDLKAEGFSDVFMDKHQPSIAIQDWYEESQVHEKIYQLHVKLLAADAKTVIAEHSVQPTEDLSNYSHTWKEVSHVFTGYGPGVRHVLFSHQVKNKFMFELFPTMVTGSSVTVTSA